MTRRRGEEESVSASTPLFTILAGLYVFCAVCWFFINCDDSLERNEATAH